MLPVIGVVPLWDENRNSLWMLPGYLEGLRSAGALPLILPLTDQPNELDRILGLCSGFLLTGGQDVDPALYGQKPSPACGRPCPARDRMEAGLLERALRADRPLLGICRGLQFLNVFLGGSLWQDLPGERPSPVNHRMTPPYDRAVHRISLIPQTPLAALSKEQTLGVNSYHHQAVRELAPGLCEMARSEDGLCKAAFLPKHRFVWGVQWHPELAPQAPLSQAVFAAFQKACCE